MQPSKKITFEDSIDIINEEIQKRRNKWTLTAIQWMDYEDISQIVRIHIHKKWNMWDQSRPIRPWLHAIVTHQISNIVRNIYKNHARPCLTCAANEGGNLCSLFNIQCNNCPLYAHWEKTKKNAYDVKLPLALEFHYNEISERPEDSFDVERASVHMHNKMKLILKPIEYKVYKYLYIDVKPEEDLGKYLGFKTSEKARAQGYRQIKNIKDSILEKAKKIIYSDEIDF